jgi:hypothetical protein
MSIEKLSTSSKDYLHWKEFAAKTPDEQQALMSMLAQACSFEVPDSRDTGFYQKNKHRFQYCINAFNHVHYFDKHDSKYVAKEGSIAWRANNPGLILSRHLRAVIVIVKGVRLKLKITYFPDFYD